MEIVNKKLMGIAASAILLSLIFLPISQSSAAMHVKVLPVPKKSPEKGFQLFVMHIRVPHNEVYQINSLKLVIDGKSVVFNTDGTITSSHKDLSKMKIFGKLKIDTDGYAVGPIRGIFLGIILKSALGKGTHSVKFEVNTNLGTFSRTNTFKIF